LVKRLFLLSILILTLLPIQVIAQPSYLISEELTEFLAPPFSSGDVYAYSRGDYSQTLYHYSLGLGTLESFAKSMKGVGSLMSESEITIILNKNWIPSFSGKIVEIEVKYSLRGYMRVQASSNPYSHSATAQLQLTLMFGSNRLVLESVTLDLYGPGFRERYFTYVNRVKRYKVQMTVSKGKKIQLRAILYVKAGAYGALEDYAFATSDFYSGSFGAKVSVKIRYKETTSIKATASPNKAYWGNTILISGRLTSSRGSPLSWKIVKLYLDGTYVSSTITSKDGFFSFKYKIPEGASTGIRNFEVKFEGDYNYLASKKNVQIVIPSFSLYVLPSSLKIPVGGSDSVTVYVVSSNGYDKPVKVTVKNAPKWLNVRFVGINEGKPTIKCYAVFSPKIPSTARVEVIATGADGQKKSIKVRITGYLKPSFKISVNPTMQSIFQGGTAIFNVTIKPLNGYSGKIYLSLVASNLKASASFSSNPVRISYSAAEVTLAISIAEITNPGIYELKVKGSDGSISRESNTFYLNVEELPKPLIEVEVFPKNQTIIVGESAKYWVNLTSLNNFKGDVLLEVDELPPYLRASLSKNLVSLSPNESELIELLLEADEQSVLGFHNITILASSEDRSVMDFFGATIIDYPAKVNLYYVHWPSGRWVDEEAFLPYEAIGVLVNYTPNTPVIIEIPQEISHPAYSSSIQVRTNSSGLASAIFLLNGPNNTFGVYDVVVRSFRGEIIGRATFKVDGASLSYFVKNWFSYSMIFFNVTWASTGEAIENRNGTIEVQLILPDNSSLRSSPILGNGSIIMQAPRLDVDAYLPARLYYAGSGISVYKNSTSKAECLVRFRSIAAHLMSSNCSDFNYHVEFQIYYRYTLEPASGVLTTLLFFDKNGSLLASVEGLTDDRGLVNLEVKLPFNRAFEVKLMCFDSSDRWVTCCKWANTIISFEDLSTIISIRVMESTLSIEMASLCGLMDLSCCVHVAIYDYAMQPQLVLDVPLTIRHGEIEVLPINIADVNADYVEVEVTYGNAIIGRAKCKVGG